MILEDKDLERIFENYGDPKCRESVGVRRAISELIDSHNELKKIVDNLCVNDVQLKVLENVYQSVRLSSVSEERMSKTAFQKLQQECSKDDTSIQLLIRQLSTIYANNMVAKGLSALIREKCFIQRTPKNYMTILDQIEDYSIRLSMEHWNMESTLGNCIDWLSDKSKK